MESEPALTLFVVLQTYTAKNFFVTTIFIYHETGSV